MLLQQLKVTVITPLLLLLEFGEITPIISANICNSLEVRTADGR